MLRRILFLSVLPFVTHAVTPLPAEFSGNYCNSFKAAFKELFTETGSYPNFTLPTEGTKILVWSHLGQKHEPQSAEDLQALLKFVQNGGIFFLCSAAPTQAFHGKNIYDLSPAADLLGAKSYVYSNPKSELLGVAQELFTPESNPYAAMEHNNPGLGGLTNMIVLMGTDKIAKLGVNRIGSGAVVYTSNAPAAKPEYADALRKLLLSLMQPNELQRLFPLPTSNQAVTVDGQVLHLALASDSRNSPLDNLLPQLLEAADFSPIIGEPSLLIHVGQTAYVNSLGLDFDSLHPYGYYIVMRDGRNLVLAGKRDAGTNYAVIDFLKRYLGYRRFLGTQELNEIIPKQPKLVLPAKLEIREEPSIHSYILAWGGGAAVFGRNSRLTCQATHALSSLVPPAKYGESHPDYFPMINGERVKVVDGKIAGPWNPCLSNPDLPKLVAEYADEYFGKHPDNLGLPMGVNDGGGDCQCPSCKAELEKTGNQYAKFYNMAAGVLAEKYPDKLISFIAYSAAATQAPKGVSMAPNILVEITGIGKVGAYNLFPAWRDSGIKHFGLYDYIYTFGSGYVTPRYYPRAMASAWREAKKEYNLETMWMELYPATGVFDAPRQYVLDEIAWNMDADVEALLDDFFNSMYQEAAQPVKRFFDLHEQVYLRKKNWKTPMSDRQKFAQMNEYTWDDLQKLEQELDAASKITLQELPKKRLEVLKKLWRFSSLRIQGNILARDLEAMQSIDSKATAEKLVELIKRGYQNIADSEAYTMSDEEQKLVFIDPEKRGLEQLKNFSYLLPLPNFENFSEPALARLSEYLLKNGQDLAAFYQKHASGSSDERTRAALLTQVYMHQHQLENLVRNPSFEDSADSGHDKPLMSDHINLQGVPGWSSWTFPSSVTKFFLNSETAHSGKYSCAIGERQIGGSIISYVGLQPNCRYRLTFWVRRNRGDEGFGMGSAGVRMQGKRGWLDQGSAITVAYPPECEHQWVKCSTIFTAPNEPATALILLSAAKQAPGAWTAFDDVSLEKVYDPEHGR
ncbi:MAG: hypothetical protein BWX73_02721 [Lentisphaerae bacterium ADurb.Bin082]|nr:MAG: hypothetical protein BWX73_02721 [Lentisphaerae bacterium ADurb.Bin082]HQL87623.1 DUF4838 domain-containing protein [Lentisphaeria bacterium]